MKKSTTIFLIGLIMFLSGIYISTQWSVIGILLGISGGLVMGSGTYFLATNKPDI